MERLWLLWLWLLLLLSWSLRRALVQSTTISLVIYCSMHYMMYSKSGTCPVDENETPGYCYFYALGQLTRFFPAKQVPFDTKDIHALETHNSTPIQVPSKRAVSMPLSTTTTGTIHFGEVMRVSYQKQAFKYRNPISSE